MNIYNYLNIKSVIKKTIYNEKYQMLNKYLVELINEWIQLNTYITFTWTLQLLDNKNDQIKWKKIQQIWHILDRQIFVQ